MYENAPYDYAVCQRAKIDCKSFDGGYCRDRDCAHAIKVRCCDEEDTRIATAALVYSAKVLLEQKQIKEAQQKILAQQEQILNLLQQQKTK